MRVADRVVFTSCQAHFDRSVRGRQTRPARQQARTARTRYPNNLDELQVIVEDALASKAIGTDMPVLKGFQVTCKLCEKRLQGNSRSTGTAGSSLSASMGDTARQSGSTFSPSYFPTQRLLNKDSKEAKQLVDLYLYGAVMY